MKEIEISSPDKILFPKDKVTKLDVVNYYVDVCESILEEIGGRILSEVRCHEGVDGECFFKKHPSGGFARVVKDKGEEYFYVMSAEELIGEVQNGALEFHVWGSKVGSLNKPDLMVFDLDPDERLPLKNLRDATMKLKGVLDELGLNSRLKTSGGKGYHVLVDIHNAMSWDKFYEFSGKVAKACELKWPQIFTTNIKKSERNGKIFLDYLRNHRGATCVSAYSIRARHGAAVSWPIRWEQLYEIKPNEVTIKNYKKYL